MKFSQAARAIAPGERMNPGPGIRTPHVSPAWPNAGLAGFASPLAFTGVGAPIGFPRAYDGAVEGL